LSNSAATQPVIFALGLAAALAFLAYTTFSSKSPEEASLPSPAPQIKPAPPLSKLPVGMDLKLSSTSTLGTSKPRAKPATAPRTGEALLLASGPVPVQAVAVAVPPQSAPVAPVRAVFVAAPQLAPAYKAPARELEQVLPPPLPPLPPPMPYSAAPRVSVAARAYSRAAPREQPRETAHWRDDSAKTFAPPPVTPRPGPAEAPAVEADDPPPIVVAPTRTAPVMHKNSRQNGRSQDYSREEMTVTISGSTAWIQVSPTRTMQVKKGDVVPNLGKVIEIKKTEVVGEKGSVSFK
jgi:hypothetical protein